MFENIFYQWLFFLLKLNLKNKVWPSLFDIPTNYSILDTHGTSNYFIISQLQSLRYE